MFLTLRVPRKAWLESQPSEFPASRKKEVKREIKLVKQKYSLRGKMAMNRE